MTLQNFYAVMTRVMATLFKKIFVNSLRICLDSIRIKLGICLGNSISKPFGSCYPSFSSIILGISLAFSDIASAALLVTFFAIILIVLFSGIFPAIPPAIPLRIPSAMLSVINSEMILRFFLEIFASMPIVIPSEFCWGVFWWRN